MTRQRLTDLADILLEAGLSVREYDGWTTRGRSGDGGWYLSGRPTHVMVHHTASASSASGQAAYIATNASYAPVANLMIDRTGLVWVIAAGPTNTNGKGTAPWTDVVADDDMNRHAIGIELCNDGIGQPYPDAQQQACLVATRALCDAYQIPVNHVRAHFEWSPGRKIDPRGPSRWADGVTMWNMGRFRTDVATYNPTPEPPAQDDEMTLDPPIRFHDSQLDDDPIPGNGVAHFLIPAEAEGAVAVEAQIHTIDPVARGYLTARPRGSGDWDDTSIGTYNEGLRETTTVRLLLGPDGFTIGNGGGEPVHVQIDLRGVYFT